MNSVLPEISDCYFDVPGISVKYHHWANQKITEWNLVFNPLYEPFFQYWVYVNFEPSLDKFPRGISIHERLSEG